MDWHIIRLASTTSTNDELHQLARQGAPAGTVVVAEVQSAGRGRRGNTWSAPLGKSLLCSVLLRPGFSTEFWPRLTHAASLAVALALEELGLAPLIKWPNDVCIGDRKICGLLLETSAATSGGYVVLGLGLNVNVRAEDFPPDLSTPATSLFIETGKQVDREGLLEAFLVQFERTWRRVEEDFPALLDAVESRSFLSGHAITLEINGMMERGIARGLTVRGGLLFEDERGVMREVLTADSVRKVSA